MNELETARRNFMAAHRAWEAVNNPAGWESGNVSKAFAHRSKVLLEYVRAREPFREIHKIIKARGS